MTKSPFVFGLLLVFSTAALAAETSSFPWPDVTHEISRLLNDAQSAYAAKDPERAKDLLSEAYFGAFEERGMEIAIRQQISAHHARELEKMFSKIRQAIGGAEPPERLRQEIAALIEALDHDARELVRLGITKVSLAEKESQPTAGGEARYLQIAAETILNQLVARLDEAFNRYRTGDAEQAKAVLESAYFDLFEGQGLEAAVGARFPQRKAEIEEKFARVRSLMTAHTPTDKVSQEVETLKTEIREAVAIVNQGQDSWSVFLNGLVIIVREGFEAILIITALTAYLLKSGHADKVRIVYQASGAALLGSLLTAVLIQALFRINPRQQEALEGATMLLATAVLFYVSYWLTSKAEANRWQQYIRNKVQLSLSTRSLAALWFAAFLAVYREGAETILFYQALLAGANPGEASAVLSGLGAGVLILILIFFLLRSGAVRVPIGVFFGITSVLLYYLAFLFGGKGIRELQNAGLIGATPATWIPSWGILGLYPTYESLGLQILLIGAAALAFTYLFLSRRRKLRDKDQPTVIETELH